MLGDLVDPMRILIDVGSSRKLGSSMETPRKWECREAAWSKI